VRAGDVVVFAVNRSTCARRRPIRDRDNANLAISIAAGVRLANISNG